MVIDKGIEKWILNLGLVVIVSDNLVICFSDVLVNV